MGEALLAAVHTRKTHTKDFLDLIGPVVPTTNRPRLTTTVTKFVFINHLHLSSLGFQYVTFQRCNPRAKICCQYICKVLATSEAVTDGGFVNCQQPIANMCRGHIGRPLVVPQTHPEVPGRYSKPQRPRRTRVLGIVVYPTQYAVARTLFFDL